MNRTISFQRRPSNGAFTLVELITVIAVMAILITIGIPAFRAALASSDKALAESQFRMGLETGRQVAIQNASRDAAAVFMFEPGGRMSIVPCIYVGTIVDSVGPGGSATLVDRDIFVPVPEISPMQLPGSWMVRGYAPPGSIDDGTAIINDWYEAEPQRVFQGSAAATLVGNWVFPENAFYKNASNSTASAADATEGFHRQSFMVRFQAGTGNVIASDTRLCLVVDPAITSSVDATGTVSDWRLNVPFYANHRIGEATDLQRFVKQRLVMRNFNGDATVDEQDAEDLRLLLGGSSCDMVLCRPLTELALYREKSLASALGARGLNAATGTIYGVSGSPRQVPERPEIDLGLFPAGADASSVALDVNLWITGRLPDPGDASQFLETDAKLFAMDRYLGQGRKLGDDSEVTP